MNITDLLNKAQALYNIGDYENCHGITIQILQKDGSNAQAVSILSSIAFKLGNPERGYELLKLAIEYKPLELIYRLAFIKHLFSTGQLAKAYSELILAKSCTKVTKSSLNVFGSYFNRLDEHEEALKVYLQGDKLTGTDNPQLFFNLATTYKFLGNLGLAKHYFYKAIDLGFDENAYLPLVEVSKNNELDDLNKFLLRKLDKYNALGKTSDELSSNLFFALALSHEKLGLNDQSFKFLINANIIKKKSLNYESKIDENLMLSLKSRFNVARKVNSEVSANTECPIFIVGLPRTGSTLVERILSNHVRVKSLGEIQTLPIEFRRLSFSSSLQVLDISVVTGSNNIDFELLANNYLNELKRFNITEGYFIDKLPYNFLYIGAIKSAFPNAKIIHTTRHPLDTCLSNFKQLYASVYPFSYDLHDIAHYYVNYRSLMKHWNELYPAEIYEISYESLITKPSEEIRKLLKYCELDWDEKCLKPHENTSSVSTASSVQVREPIGISALERWKLYEEQLEPIAQFF